MTRRSTSSSQLAPPVPADYCQSAFAACSRPDVASLLQQKYDDLGGWPTRQQLPVLYSEDYNISFWGLERLHPFDSKKFRGVLNLLEASSTLRAGQLVQAQEAAHGVLREVHTERYLRKLNSSSFTVAQVTELVPLVFLPPFLLRRKVLRPMAAMAGGTMLAAALAIERGWALNIGGGMHHAMPDSGGGWCVYADVHLAIRRLRTASGGALKRFMIIDLDVHQGNGVERCQQLGEEAAEDVFILDIYNGSAYPWDTQAKKAINVKRELRPGTSDAEYLEVVSGALQEAFTAFPHPDLVLFLAGTDILAGDPLGRLSVSAEGVLRRDEMVWQAALDHGAPIVQVLAGGYTRESTPCIAASIENLFQRFDLGHL